MNDVLNILVKTGAILEGHFLLTSGLHSDRYVEKFRLIEQPKSLDMVCSTMADLYRDKEINLVLGAAIGGILISGGVGQKLNVKHIFTERVNGVMTLRRGFEINEHSKVLIVEDIVTTGGSIFELIEVVKENNGQIVGVTSILDRNEEPVNFGFPYHPLVQYSVKSWNKSDCPQCLDGKSMTQRGRSGK